MDRTIIIHTNTGRVNVAKTLVLAALKLRDNGVTTFSTRDIVTYLAEQDFEISERQVRRQLVYNVTEMYAITHFWDLEKEPAGMYQWVCFELDQSGRQKQFCSLSATFLKKSPDPLTAVNQSGILRS